MAKPKLSLIKKEIKVNIKNRKATEAATKITKKTKKIFRYKPQYSLNDKILLVGEGNFSFSLALSEHIHGGFNMTCTTFDSENVMNGKYPDAAQITSSLKEMGADLLYDIDATLLNKVPELKNKR